MTSEELAAAKATEIVPSASDSVTGQPGSVAQLAQLSQSVMEHARHLLDEDHHYQGPDTPKTSEHDGIGFGEILQLPMGQNCAGAATVGDYLKGLLSDLWQLGDGLGAKYPSGKLSWWRDVYTALAKAGAMAATFSSDGALETYSPAEAERLVRGAIDYVFANGVEND
jgi:hypothetical protein